MKVQEFLNFHVLWAKEGLNTLKSQFPKKLHCFVLDGTVEQSVVAFSDQVDRCVNRVDVIINAIGELHKGGRPEKNVSEISLDAFLRSMKVNAAPTLLIAKAFREQILSSENAIFATLSAKVGSLTDNRSGGWYSYRASKAALNMCIKNLSIEFNRLRPRCAFIAIHPGTTDTELSAPFIENARKKYVIHSSQDTAENIFKIISSMEFKNSNGKFLTMTDVDKYHQLEKINRLFYVKQTIEIEKVK